MLADAGRIDALDNVQVRRQHLKHTSAASEIPKFSISTDDSCSHGRRNAICLLIDSIQILAGLLLFI